MIDFFLGDALRAAVLPVLEYCSVVWCSALSAAVLPVLEYCSVVWCSATDTHLRLLHRVVSGASFLTGVCLMVTMQVVDRWQYYVCCTRSAVTRCTLFVVLFLRRMCRWGLQAAL